MSENDQIDAMIAKLVEGVSGMLLPSVLKGELAHVMGLLAQRNRELAAANERAEKALAWTDEDKPLPEDAEIHAHHPVVNGSDKTYEEALRLVGAKRSKGALVDLVNWLLQRAARNEEQKP